MLMSALKQQVCHGFIPHPAIVGIHRACRIQASYEVLLLSLDIIKDMVIKKINALNKHFYYLKVNERNYVPIEDLGYTYNLKVV